MQINLLEIPVVIASVDKPSYRQRQLKIISSLKQRGFKNIKVYNGPQYDPYPIAVAQTRLEIFQRYNSIPITILEDDAVISEAFKPVISIPNDAEILYLGAAYHKSSRTLSYADVPDYMVKRLFRTCGMHATLFINKRAIRRYSKIMTVSVTKKIHPDKTLLTYLKRIKTYVPHQSFFYQPDKKEITDIDLSEIIDREVIQ